MTLCARRRSSVSPLLTPPNPGDPVDPGDLQQLSKLAPLVEMPQMRSAAPAWTDFVECQFGFLCAGDVGACGSHWHCVQLRCSRTVPPAGCDHLVPASAVQKAHCPKHAEVLARVPRRLGFNGDSFPAWWSTRQANLVYTLLCRTCHNRWARMVVTCMVVTNTVGNTPGHHPTLIPGGTTRRAGACGTRDCG